MHLARSDGGHKVWEEYRSAGRILKLGGSRSKGVE